MERLVVYYDSWCPVCTKIRGRLEQLDWLGALRFESTREPGLSDRLGVSPESLARRMHVRYDGSGRLVDGIDAIVAIAARVPLLLPTWPVMKFTAMVGLGQRLYDWVATRRQIVPVGHCEGGSCSLTLNGHDRP